MVSGEKIGYVRVSTIEQDDTRQKEALKMHQIDKYFIEQASAKDINRPKLQEMLNYAREGDVVYVKDFSRLARSTRDLLQIADVLNEKNVKLVSLKENLDSNTSTGKLMLTMIAAIYEFERENLLERQREGIAIARKNGKYKGRKAIKHPENWESIYIEWKQRNITGRKAMQELELKPNTFYKLVKEWELRKSG